MRNLLFESGCLQVVTDLLKSSSTRISQVLQANAISLLYDLLSGSDASKRMSVAMEAGILPVLIQVNDS